MFIFVWGRDSKLLLHIALVSHDKYARLKVILEEKFPLYSAMASFCLILFFCGLHTEFFSENYFPFFEITDMAPRGSKSPWVSESLVHPSQIIIIIIIMNTAA